MPWLPWPASSQPKRADTADEERTNDDTRSILPTPRPAPSSSNTWTTNLNKTDWSQYTSTQAITSSLLFTATTLALVKIYKDYIRRIPGAAYLKPGFFRRRSLYGYVSSVGDGDNFRLFHTPGGRLMGWGWLPSRRMENLVHQSGKAKGNMPRGETIGIRIAGVDAPEAAHFGKPEQPYAREALEWLRGEVLHKYVRAYPYRRDQYERVVCTVYKRKWVFFRTDVGLQMLKRGLATVYEAKFGSEFGDQEEKYREVEAKAKKQGVGMWKEPGIIARFLGAKSEPVESPREYKTRTAKAEGVEAGDGRKEKKA